MEVCILNIKPSNLQATFNTFVIHHRHFILIHHQTDLDLSVGTEVEVDIEDKDLDLEGEPSVFPSVFNGVGRKSKPVFVKGDSFAGNIRLVHYSP